MVKDSQSYNAGKKDTDRSHLFEDKGNIQQKKLENKPHGFSFFGKIVYLLKKINKDIDSNESGHERCNVSDKLGN